MKNLFFLILFVSIYQSSSSQIVINEGSNKNYSTIADEDGEYEDWIELYNAGSSSVDLFDYKLSDDSDEPNKWILPHLILPPGGYTVIYCSGKNRYESTPFTNVLTTGIFNPTSGWNTHNFTTPFFWDGTSNIVLNICSYNDNQYTENSIHNQSATTYNSSTFAFIDGSDQACSNSFGTTVSQRPNVQFNGTAIDNGTVTNNNTGYPAPYGNWYWCARHQFLYRASELSAAGLSAGFINSLSFDVESTNGETYTYIDLSILSVNDTAMTNTFYPSTGLRNHTNFKLKGNGENVFLYSPAGVLISQLDVNCEPSFDISSGNFPDGNSSFNLFSTPTPNASNNSSSTSSGILLDPTYSVASGFFTTPFSVNLINPNPSPSEIYYTTDGSTPTTSSSLYTGSSIPVTATTIIRAKAFQSGFIPSPAATSSYFFNINHTTPIISVVTDNDNLYGSNGMFDNPFQDWLKSAHAEYFDSTSTHNLLFSQKVGIIMDGGLGGSRGNPQRSFRIKWNDGTLGEGPLNYPFIPDRESRTLYSDFYIRNGSNQWLTLPYKDASQVRMMSEETNTYYSAMRPVTVYVNGEYFGLYELREKYNKEMFNTQEGADMDSIELLSLSAYYGYTLRALEGSLDSFTNDYNDFNALDPADANYWNQADTYFDLKSYADYIIAESWMGNIDWPGNNIKIYRSNTSDWRWRFCVIDLELCMSPNGWSTCTSNHIDYMNGQSTDLPFINIWLQSIQNGEFKNYFINRFADQMNTLYLTSRLHSIENYYYSLFLNEMGNEYARWGDPADVPGQLANFTNNHNVFQDELACRSEQVRNHIQANFTLPQQVEVTLNTMPAGAGKINISTITPDIYPWSGIYFDGVPLQIEAEANPGYTFSHWGNNGLISDTMNVLFNDTLTSDTTNFTAYFTENPISSIEEESNLFSLFPNPTNEFINLVYADELNQIDFKYEIVDMSGRKILTGEFQNASKNTMINVSKLDNGIYSININSSAGSKTLKFIKID